MSDWSRDRGLLLGDGLFETVLWSRGALAAFEAHAERLARGCRVLGLPDPGEPRLRTAALAAVAEAGLEDERAAVRLTWTAGAGGRGLDRPDPVVPELLVSAYPAPAPAGPARLALSSVRRNESSPTSRLKTLAYLDSVLARREARAAGADEAVMLNTLGEVASAAAANVFWFEGARLCTPALECGVLDGIMRGRVLAAAGEFTRVEEGRFGLGSLSAGKGLFLTNSLIGVRAVASFDGRSVAPHPGVEILARTLAETG